MIPFIITALDYLLFGWLFWIVVAICFLPPYYIIKSAKEEFAGSAFLFVAALIGACYWRWRAAFPHDLSGWLWTIGAYLFAGFVFSSIKYLGKSADFKEKIKGIVAKFKATDIDDPFDYDKLETMVRNAFSYEEKDHYIFDGKSRSITLNWRVLPLGNWWVYWPYFLLSWVFEFIGDLGTHLKNACKGFYEKIANHFSVKY